MPYSIQTIASYFLEKAIQDKQQMTPLKLIKLICCADQWYLEIVNRRLFQEPFTTAKYSALIKLLYPQLKQLEHGSDQQLLPAESSRSPIKTKKEKLKLDQDQEIILLLNKIWEVYGPYSGFQLAELSHGKNLLQLLKNKK